MSRLPAPGQDSGQWGDILNDYLSQTHKSDGTLKDDIVTASALAPNSVTSAAIATDAVSTASIADGSITETLLATAVQTKLNAAGGTSDWSTIANKPAVIAAGADAAAAKATLSLTKADVGLGNVDNTSDAAKNSASATLTNKTLGSDIKAVTYTTTAATTTTLTSTSTPLQAFTGSTTQTVVLPTTSVVAGQSFTIINQSTATLTVNASGGTITSSLSSNNLATFIALQAAPTLPAHWTVIGNFPINGMYIGQSPSAFTVPQRDAQSNLRADAFIPGVTTTGTTATTTTLTVDATQVQVFTGTTTQTITLPTTSIIAGQQYLFINQSTGTLTVNASGGAQVIQLPNSATVLFTAVVATPTTAAHWDAHGLSGIPVTRTYSGGAYPARASTGPVTWIGPTPPTFGPSAAIDGDTWINNL